MNPAFRIACVTGVALSAWAPLASAQLVGPKPALILDRTPKPAPAEKAEPEANIPELIKQLGDPSITRRDEAERRLSATSMTQEQLERAIQDPAASPEQRVRLERLGPRVLFQSPRAAMGISFSQNDLEVAQLHEGFESLKVLKVGDQIVAIDRHPVFTMRELRPAIIMHPPGTEVPVRIVRDGRVMTVRLKLGDFGSLPRSPWRDSVTFDDCSRAWDLRTTDLQEARRHAGRDATLDVGLSAESWHHATRTEPGAKATSQPWGDSTLVAAGQSRAVGEDVRNNRPRLTGLGEDRREQRVLRQMEDLRRFADLQRKLQAGNLDAAARTKLQAEMDEVMSRVFEGLNVAPGEQRIP